MRSLRSGWLGPVAITALVVVWIFSLWSYDSGARQRWREDRDLRLDLTAENLEISIARAVHQDLSNVEHMLLTWLNTQTIPNDVVREERLNAIAARSNYINYRVLERRRNEGWHVVAGDRYGRSTPLAPILATESLQGSLVLGPMSHVGQTSAECLLYAGAVGELGQQIIIEVTWLITPETINPLQRDELDKTLWAVRDRNGEQVIQSQAGELTGTGTLLDINLPPWLQWKLTVEPLPSWYEGVPPISRQIWLIGGIALILSIALLVTIESKNKILVTCANHSIETAALLETVLDGSEDYSIIATDLSGRIVRANHGTSRLYGHLPVQLIGKPIVHLSHHQAPSSDRLDNILRLTLESRRYDDVVAVRRADGSIFHVQLSSAVRTDAEGHPIGFVIITHDVTDLLDRTMKLEHLNSQLAEQTRISTRANRLINEFLANMSHELRTPLNAILGYAKLIQRKTSGQIDERQTKNLDHIQEAGTNLLRLINDLLDLSKIQAGRMPIQCEEVSLLRIINEVIDTVRPLAESQRDDLVLEISDPFPTMISDSHHLRQIAMNLIANAIKFTSKGTITVELRMGQDPQTVQFVVSDTGIGIPEEQLPHIFEAFYQVDGSSSRSQGGTGLGLSIVHRLVEQLGGTISADSTVGEGTIFIVTLPREITAEIEREPKSAEPLAPAS